MTKNQYLEELRKELKLNNVDGIDDIISEYEEHFDFKMEEGLTEEEIAKKLSAPKDIAKMYVQSNVSSNNSSDAAKVSGVVALSIPLACVYALMWCCIVVLGGFALVSVVTGFCLITTVNIENLIPHIPYFPSLMIGFAAFALAVLSAIGTFYLFMYVKQWGKAYLRWCKNQTSNTCYPSLSLHPKIEKKVAFRLKLVAIIGLAVFVATFAIGFASMCIAANSFEPWHVWHWFE